MRNEKIIAETPHQTFRDNVDFFQLLSIVRRGKWIVLLFVLLAAIPAWYYANRVLVPIYTASTRIVLINQKEQFVDLASPLSALSTDYYSLQTEVETLRARKLIERVVVALELEKDPEFNGYLVPYKPSLLGSIRESIRALFAEPAPPASPPTARQIRSATIDSVLGAIGIANVPESYVFSISASSTDPEKAALIADTLAEMHIENQIAVKYEATERAANWLADRVTALRGELEAAENAVKEFNTGTELVSTEALTALNRQLKDFRNRVRDLNGEIVEGTARVTALEAAKEAGDPAGMAETAGDAGLTGILRRIGEPNARALFDERFDNLLERAWLEVRRNREQEASIKNQIVELETRIEAQSADLLTLEQLQREAQANRQIYEYFLNRLKEISVQQGIHSADSRILSTAVVPGGPDSPRKGMIMAIWVLCGLTLGTAYVILRDLRRNGFRSATDLERATGLNVLAAVPQAPIRRRRGLLSYMIHKPSSAMVEAVRNLRTSILLSNLDDPPQIIMVTSSLPDEGKTTVSLALTRSFASMGKRTLLIEGDVRRRALQAYFRIRKRPGLLRVVAGDIPLSEAVLYSEELGADVLIGEKSNINAADFFSSSKFAELLESLRGEYETIIIDTPPVLVVPDARVIGQLVDATLHVVRWNQTTQIQLEEGINFLTTVNVKITGLVLSQVDLKKVRQYGGEYKELYQSYGAKYYNN